MSTPHGLVPIDAHLARVLAATPVLTAVDVALDDACGRVLATDVRAVVPIPAWVNSAMDGYAVRRDDVVAASPGNGVTLTVVADLPAGSSLDPALRPGEAARIMTGAVVPSDADAVVPLEQTDRDDPTAPLAGTVTVLQAPEPGAHLRHAGEDREVGDLVVAAGTRLDGAALAAVSSAGHGRVRVTPAPRVAVIATGSELVAPGEALVRGTIPDSNSLLVAGLVRDAGGEVVAQCRVNDDPRSLADLLAGLACDVVVLTGGVSEGAFDPVKMLFTGSREVAFARVGMQPGKPQAFGVLRGEGAGEPGPADAADLARGDRLLLGLPGNPVSAWVSFHTFVRPALLRLQGAREVTPPRHVARAVSPWRTPPGRTQYLPARIALGTAGAEVTPVAALGSKSHLVGSLADANGYAIVPAEVERVHAGDVVDVVLTGLPDLALPALGEPT